MRCRFRKQCPELAELDNLRTLLHHARLRLAECVCHGEHGSQDYADHRQLLSEIDAALPREQRDGPLPHDNRDGPLSYDNVPFGVSADGPRGFDKDGSAP